MSQTDPYSPPQASLGGLTPSEQHDRDHGVLRYSTFWQRVGATLIDTLIMLPLILLEFFFDGQSRMYYLYEFVPMQLFTLFFSVWLVAKYGGTPGKLLLGLRVANLDGSAVSLKTATLRYSVWLVLGIALSIMMIVAALGMTDEAYMALGYMERSEAFDARMPWIEPLTWLMVIWPVACIVTMLTNEKRRTLHDFIAATVVVRK